MSEKPAETTSEMTQLEKDQQWRDEVFQGDGPQLTVRAIVTGLMLGWVMALANLYIGLKSGWGIGVEVTAVVLAFTIWKAIQGMRLTKHPLGMLENNIVMTCAVAPSYIVSAGLVSSIPAIMMLNPDFHIAWWQLGFFMMSILFLGLTVAIPLKRQVVNTGELVFPAAVPTAETLKSIYSRGEEAVKKASSLGIAGVVGIMDQVLMHKGILPSLFFTNSLKIGGIGMRKLTLAFEPSLLFVGIGAFIGPRIGITMIVGMVLNFAVLAPWMINKKEIVHPAPELRSVTMPEFPLTVPAGSALCFDVEEAVRGPELEAGSETVHLVKHWPDSTATTYPDQQALIADLNHAGANNTLPPVLRFESKRAGVRVGEETYHPVPFIKWDFIPFTMTRPVMEKRNELTVSAPEYVGWEARLALVVPDRPDAAPLLGFEPGAERTEHVGSFRNIVAWTMWPGVGMMVMAGLMTLLFQWRTIGSAFSGLFRRKGSVPVKDPVGDVEIPMSWFAVGFFIFGVLAIFGLSWLFHIPFWMGIIAVIMSLFLAVVSIRASGETGIIPIGAMGKVTQLTFGVIHPGHVETNLMTATVTAGAATSASDLTNQLKVGHMIGAKARMQFIAQLFGILSSIAVIPVFFVMVPDASAIGGADLPAPSAIVWAGVARLLSNGIGTLPSTAVVALVIASLFGIGIAIFERLYPKARSWVWLPSPAAMGIAMIVPSWYSLSMFIGAMIALILAKAAPKTNETYTIPVASGFIAGEALTGVFFAILAVVGG